MTEDPFTGVRYYSWGLKCPIRSVDYSKGRSEDEFGRDSEGKRTSLQTCFQGKNSRLCG